MEIIMAFTKQDIAAALGTPAQVSRAIEILGNNQRDDELAARSTKVQNGIGFTSCWASAGTALWQFVTGWDARAKRNRWGRKCLSHPNWQRAKIIRRKVHNNDCADAVELGRKIALHHWRQLGEILPGQPVLASIQTPAPAPQPEPQADFEMIAVPADKVAMAMAILKAAGVI
jgi:hypothetical protein